MVVDDEPGARAAILDLLSDDAAITVVAECGDGLAALAYLRERRPELIFLDVQMPELDGLAVLRALPPQEWPVVVFTTAYDQYTLEAFELHAVDYVLKPFDDTRFLRALDHAKRCVRETRLGVVSAQLLALLGSDPKPGANPQTGSYLTRLVAKRDGRVTVISVRDVDWIEANGDYACIHCGRAQHLVRESLTRLAAQLDPARFVRIHRSTIVSIDRIRGLEPYFRGEYVVILHDATRLKLSRERKPQLESVLGRSF